ncbi:MAG: TIGR00730 family Rossman fold protein [Planctomycetaceae bacterium]|nr:TIGR00730 family Rossman fold protein [Planctomycetaceae bacterium]
MLPGSSCRGPHSPASVPCVTSKYRRPFGSFLPQMKSLCVFCGSSTGSDPVFQQAAVRLAEEIIRRDMRLIYGGGNIGLMGIVADAVLAGGGEVVGVIPHALARREVAHANLTGLILVESMHERKARMAQLADGFIAMPGGFGTFEEFCEVLTWNQLGIHTKPCGLLNVEGFYDSLIALFDHARDQKFLRPQHRDIVVVDSAPDRLIDQMLAMSPATGDKWLNESQS